MILRVTLEVEANGAAVTSSNVVKMRYSTGVTGTTLRVEFGGHAPYIRVGENGLLLLPFDGGTMPQLGLRDVIYKTFKLAESTSKNMPMTDHLAPISSSRGEMTYPLDDKVTPRIVFIYLPDRLTASTARRKSIDELAKDYGIIIKAIRLQAVSERVTNTIKSVLPWIDLRDTRQPWYRRDLHRTTPGDYLINIYTFQVVGQL